MKNILGLATVIGQMGTQVDHIGAATGTARLTAIMGAIPVLLPLSKVDFKAAREELKASTDEQKQEIDRALANAFDLKNDKLEAVIEHGITLAVSGYDVVTSGLALMRDIKDLKKDDQPVIAQ